MRSASIFTLLTALAAFSWPTEAEACGGTFCDSGPQSMPVDQTGENIIFVLDGEYVEAHIQIQYDPDTPAERFAWVVPLTAVPEFSVGSQQLFTNVLGSTVPNYGFSTWNETCGGGGGGDDGGWCGDGDGDGDGDGGGGFIPTADLGGNGGPDIVKHEFVGAFEITVLQGGTAEEVMTWLGDNGYEQDPAAEPILQEYLDEGHLFAAFKLANGAETNEIHPIVIRYEGMEPCIPLRLTQIAAADDMGVRAFFFGDDRAVPTNYAHVELNQAAVSWRGLGQNYDDIVALAVDEDMADGHAFVTEYAGSSVIVPTTGLLDPDWDAEMFEDALPWQVVDMLSYQGLYECYGQQDCWRHPLIESVVKTHLPLPEGVDEFEFYDCLECYATEIDMDAWDPEAFADDFHARIVGPGLRATEVLQTWPFLTRMYTRISGYEMTLDPVFHTNPDLPSVGSLALAQQNRYCNGEEVFVLPGGRDLAISGASWPNIADLPAAERIQMVPMAGAPQVLVDNTKLIEELIDDWNASHGWYGYGEGNQPRCDSSDDGGEWGDDGSADDDGPGSSGVHAVGGCGCTSADEHVPGALGLGLLGLGLLGLRRRH